MTTPTAVRWRCTACDASEDRHPRVVLARHACQPERVTGERYRGDVADMVRDEGTA